MNIVSKSDLKIEGYDKCSLICDSDCPIGELYDYASSLKAFIVSKISEIEKAQKEQEHKKVDPIEDSQN